MLIIAKKNIYILILNLNYNIGKNVRLLKKLVQSYKLIINNDSNFAIFLLSHSIVFIIYLGLNNLELNLLFL